MTSLARSRAIRLLDPLVLAGLVATAFLLGYQELFDADVWWHVRSGQWIWEHRRVPWLDPFTFGSADRVWIDLHWLFQLILAGAYAAGGVPGMIVLASSLAALSVAIMVIPECRRDPSWLTAACWLPAVIVMSSRFDPRPEILSLVGVAIYLAVLRTIDEDNRPALAWLLPPVQLLWVNAHALFILGPIILSIYLTDRVVSTLWQPRSGPVSSAQSAHWWRSVGGAAGCVLLACLINPYGIRGALFPFELFPKIASGTNAYKNYITEMMSMRMMVAKLGPAGAGGDLFFSVECGLLMALPIAFLVPSIFRLAGRRADRPMVWAGALLVAIILVVAQVLGFPAAANPGWLVRFAGWIPYAFLVLGAIGAILLAGVGQRAAMLSLVGGIAQTFWVVWLRIHLFGPDGSPLSWYFPANLIETGATAFVVVLLPIAAYLCVCAKARWYHILLATAFSYLGLTAVRNITLLGAIAAHVIISNISPFLSELFPRPTADDIAPRTGLPGLAARGLSVVAIGLFIFTVVTGRFYRNCGEQRFFGARETSLAYAHDAARFAGQAGLPERALALDLRQAGVYLFHNGPGRKVLIDGRLELPSRPSFDRFVRLSDKIREGRPGWSDLLRGMGDPLILLDHEEDVGAEATLMAQPGWRCLYFDAIASVFVAQRDDGRDAAIPTLDFAARHFHDAAWRSVPPLPAGLGEARALVKLGTAVRRRPGFSWPRRMALMLTAADRLRQGLNAQLDAAPRATLWAMLGHTTWNMAPDFSRPPLGVDESWELAAGIPLAQASFCYQQALELDPREQSALISLHDSYKARRMYDAQEAMATRIRALASPSAQRVSWPAEAKSQSNLEPPSAGDISTAILATIDQGRPLEAITMFDAAEKRGLTLPWGPRDQLAAALVQLGRPQVARHVWESAKDAPSAAILDARRGDTFLAELDFPSAQRAYQRAVESDSQLADAWIGLAYLHTQSGDAAEAIAAVRAGLALPAISTRGKALLEGLLELIEPLDSMR